MHDTGCVWHVGLDAEACALLNDRYRCEELDEARHARLLALCRLRDLPRADGLTRSGA